MVNVKRGRKCTKKVPVAAAAAAAALPLKLRLCVVDNRSDGGAPVIMAIITAVRAADSIPEGKQAPEKNRKKN